MRRILPLLLVAVLGGLVLLAIGRRREVELPTRAETAPPKPPLSAPPAPPAPVKSSTLTREWDLLRGLLDQRTPLPPRWKIEGERLLVPAARYSRLTLGQAPTAGAYDLEIVAERLTKESSLVLSIAVGGYACAIVIDGGQPPCAGLDQLDGKPFYENESTSSGSLFRLGQSTRLLVRIRGESVALLADGKSVFEWRGNPERLSLYKRWKSETASFAFFLGSWDSSFSVTEVKLRTE